MTVPVNAAGWRVILRDPALPHQIVIYLVSGKHNIAFSCNCRRVTEQAHRGGHYVPSQARYKMIEVRSLWETGEIMAAWRAWHAARGISIS